MPVIDPYGHRRRGVTYGRCPKAVAAAGGAAFSVALMTVVALAGFAIEKAAGANVSGDLVIGVTVTGICGSAVAAIGAFSWARAADPGDVRYPPDAG